MIKDIAGTENMRIEPYEKGLFDAVVSFLEKCLPQSGRTLEMNGRHSYYNDIEGNFEWFRCLFDGSELIATVALKRLGDRKCELKSLYLYEKYHGRGLGRFLLETALDEARSRGYEEIYLDTISTSERAIRLYRKAGFTETEKYNDSPAIVDLFMKRSLKDDMEIRLRPYIAARDFEHIQNWFSDERTFAMWSAQRVPYPPERESFDAFLSELAAQQGDSPFVATDENGTVVGFFCYSLNYGSGEGMLKFIVVDSSVRGKGIGTKMLKLAVKYAFEISGAKAVHLNVFSVNDRAKRCYEKVGFTVRDVTENAFAYKDEKWDRINMIVYK